MWRRTDDDEEEDHRPSKDGLVVDCERDRQANRLSALTTCFIRQCCSACTQWAAAPMGMPTLTVARIPCRAVVNGGAVRVSSLLSEICALNGTVACGQHAVPLIYHRRGAERVQSRPSTISPLKRLSTVLFFVVQLRVVEQCNPLARAAQRSGRQDSPYLSPSQSRQSQSESTKMEAEKRMTGKRPNRGVRRATTPSSRPPASCSSLAAPPFRRRLWSHRSPP